MMKRHVSGILLGALAACGPAVATDGSPVESQCEPWAEVCQVSLLPSWDARAVLTLEIAGVTAEPTDTASDTLDEGQVRASLGRYLALQSNPDGPLICLLTEDFLTLDEVPTDASVCDCEALVGCWQHTVLFGLLGTGTADEDFGRSGLMLKTANGDLYRARILVAESSFDDGTLSIEYEGVM